jgi:hypothetical protein
VCLAALGAQLQMLKAQILSLIAVFWLGTAPMRRAGGLMSFRCRTALATALVASIPDPKAFRSERNFSAWIGPILQRLLQHSAPVAWRGRGIRRNGWRNGLARAHSHQMHRVRLIAGMG